MIFKLFLYTLVPFTVRAAFRWNDCGPAGSTITVAKFDVTPDPLILPGSLSSWLEVNVTRPLSNNTYADIIINRESLSLDLPLPCPDPHAVGADGKCKFQVCDLMDKYFKNICKSHLGFKNFPCSCPIFSGTYAVNNFTMALPFDISAFTGNYEINLKLWDKEEEVGCIKFPLKI